MEADKFNFNTSNTSSSYHGMTKKSYIHVSLRKQYNEKRLIRRSKPTVWKYYPESTFNSVCSGIQFAKLDCLNEKNQKLNRHYSKLCDEILIKFEKIRHDQRIDYQDLLCKFTQLRKIMIELDDSLLMDNRLVTILSKMVHWKIPISFHQETLSLLITFTNINDEYIHFLLHNVKLFNIILNFLQMDSNILPRNGNMVILSNEKLEILNKYLNLLGNLFSINIQQKCISDIYNHTIEDKVVDILNICIKLLDNYQYYNRRLINKITWCMTSFLQFNNSYSTSNGNTSFLTATYSKLVQMFWIILGETYWDSNEQKLVCTNYKFSLNSILEILWSMTYLSEKYDTIGCQDRSNMMSKAIILPKLLVPNSNLNLPILKMLNNLLLREQIDVLIITELLPHLTVLLDMDSRNHIKRQICLIFVNYTDFSLIGIPLAILNSFVLQLTDITKRHSYYISKETCLAICNICNQCVVDDNINILVEQIFNNGFGRILYNFIQDSDNDLVLILLETCHNLLKTNINAIKYQQMLYHEGLANILAQLAIHSVDNSINRISEILLDKYFTVTSD